MSFRDHPVFRDLPNAAARLDEQHPDFLAELEAEHAALRARLAEAVEALKPFARVTEEFGPAIDPHEVIFTDLSDRVEAQHFLRARARSDPEQT